MKNCWLPYYHIEIIPQLKLRPCCRYGTDWLTSINDFYSKDRTEFEGKNLSKNCETCNLSNSYKDVKIKHFKSVGLQEPTKPDLISLTIFLDNVCSNSCLMCNKDASTTVGYLLNNQVKKSFDLDSIDNQLKTLKYISILGGEPLQSPNLKKFCQKLNKSNLKQVNILTSCAKPTQGNIEALEALETKINFRISIDGPQDLNQWIRGYKYKDWIETFEKLQRIGTINWQVTLGSYNVFALPECFNYLETLLPNKNILPSIVYYPDECHIKQLPPEYKIKIKNKLLKYSAKFNQIDITKTALELLNLESTLDWTICKEYINRLPKLRGESLTIDYFLDNFNA